MSKGRKIFFICFAVILSMVFGTWRLASAHTDHITADCDTGLTVKLSWYQNHNKLKIYQDNSIIVNTTFDGGYTHNFPNPDKTKSHVWRVVVDASDSSQWDVDKTKTVDACVEPTTTTSTTTTTTTTTLPPTTTSTSTTTTTTSTTTSTSTTSTTPVTSTTTTVPRTTTTVAPTTTAAVTSTTGAPTTTAVATTVPPTTVVESTSTSVEVLPSVVSTTTIPPIVTIAPTLPQTGNGSWAVALTGLVLIGIGGALFMLRRKDVS